jgi:hypothetical protein
MNSMTAGFMKVNAQGAVVMDTNTYLTGVTSGQVTGALGYTPVQPNGTGASGTWGINVSGNSQYFANNYIGQADANSIWRAGSYTFFNGVNVPGGDFGLISFPTWSSTDSNSRYNIQLGANIGGNLRYRSTNINGAASWSTMLSDANYNSYSPTLTGGGASGTWGINVTGTSSRFASGQSNWGGTGIIDSVIGLIAWKNYGNSHVIFDASAGTSPSGGGVSQTNATVAWSATYPTLMGWNGSTTYGVRVDSSRISDNTSGNSATTSQRDFSGDISTSGMGRFTGWYNGNAATGLAAEIGISAGQAYIIAYNRQTSSYGTLNLESSAATLRLSGSTVNVVSGALQQGGNQVLHAGNYTSYSPTLTGSGASGTWGINITGNAGNASTVSGITPSQIFNNMGDNHPTRTSFDASTPSYNFGFRYIQGSGNGPGTGGGQFYSWYIGLGNDYPATGSGSYGAMFAVDRNTSSPYLSVRYNENNGFGSWRRISAGYADSAGSLSSMNISQFTNNSGYVTSSHTHSSFGNLSISPSSASWAEGISFTMPSTSTWGGLRWRRERGSSDGNWYIGFTALDSTDDLVFGANNGGGQIDNIIRLQKDGSVRFRYRTSIFNYGSGGGQNLFTGLDSPDSASGRAQLVLSSAYSDLVIASSQANNNHGSTLTFATFNPGNAADYRKFVINQGNWGSRAGFLDFGFADAGSRSNPHTNINASDDVMSLDGYNKRLGINIMSPSYTLDVAGLVNTASGYISVGNPWGTSNSAFFPNGITTAGGTNWIYGFTYIGNAPGNGAGHEFYTSGSSYSTGNVEAAGSMRAPIFYDRNDTGYYLDPNGTSNLQTWTADTAARLGRSRYWTNRWAIYGGINGHMTGTNGWGMDHGGWDTAWKGGFSGWDIWGGGTGHPQGSGYIHAQGIVSGLHHAAADGTDAYGWMIVGAHNATENRYWLRGRWSNSISGWTEMMTSGNNPIAWNMNQYVRTSDNVTFAQVNASNIYASSDLRGNDVYTAGGWFRNHTNSNGIYWSATGWHLYPKDGSDFYLRSGSSDASIQFMRGGTASNYIHNASDNAIGFLSTTRSWIFRVDNGGTATVYGDLTCNSLFTGNYINIGYNRNSESISTSAFRGIDFHTTSDFNYYIGKPAGSWVQPLHIHFFTGIRLRSHQAYGGTQFYNIANGATTASVNDGDSNMRGFYDIIAYASDRRLKENVQVIGNAVDKVKQLTGMTYTWNSVGTQYGWSPSSEREAGVFAQDVQAVLPEAVRLAPFDNDGGKSKSGENFLTVKYEKIVPLLIEAIKEQQTQIEELKTLVNALTK